MNGDSRNGDSSGRGTPQSIGKVIKCAAMPGSYRSESGHQREPLWQQYSERRTAKHWQEMTYASRRTGGMTVAKKTKKTFKRSRMPADIDVTASFLPTAPCFLSVKVPAGSCTQGRQNERSHDHPERLGCVCSHRLSAIRVLYRPGVQPARGTRSKGR